MAVSDHESVLAGADGPVLLERQVNARQTRGVRALAEKRDGFTADRRLEGASQAFVPDPEGTLGFGKAVLLRVQGDVSYPGLWRVNESVLRRGCSAGEGWQRPAKTSRSRFRRPLIGAGQAFSGRGSDLNAIA
jgi:hypothetical protein